MSEFSSLRGGNEGCGACDDDKQEKALALLWRLGGHFRPQCGRFPELQTDTVSEMPIPDWRCL